MFSEFPLVIIYIAEANATVIMIIAVTKFSRMEPQNEHVASLSKVKVHPFSVRFFK